MSYKKWIPFKINNRKFVTLTFASDENQREISEFVCDGKATGFIDLLLFSGTLQATSNMERRIDTKVSLRDIIVDEENPNFITLVFTPIPQPAYTVASDEDKVKLLERLQLFNTTWKRGNISCGPEEEGDKSEEEITVTVCGRRQQKKKERITVAKQLRLRHVNTREYRKIVVDIKIEEERTYLTTLVFHLIPQTNFCMLALDFGSEASQMSIRYQDRGQITPLKLLETARKLPEFEDLKDEKPEAFHQYTSDEDGKLFQSFFYAKNETKSMNPVFLSKTTDDDKYNKKGVYTLLPSLKISLLNDSENRGFLNCYRKIISKFLQTAIAQIETDNYGNLPEHVGLQLNLLVPNVMEMKTTKDFVRNILGGFEALQDEKVKYRKIHLEITTRSESDASFAGYFYRHSGELSQGKNYLVIDGGKGTMDFSIIRLEEKTEYKSLYRNGFIGSGNAITYAIFDHLCAIILGTPDVKERKELMQSILFHSQNDQAGLKKLLLVIEKIKKNYEQSEKEIESNCNALHNEYAGLDLSELTAAGLAEKLEHEKLIGSFGDKYGIIHATCSNICASLFYNLEKNNISSTKYKNESKNDAQICFDEVILAGRAFMFKMLRDELECYLHDNCLLDKHNIQFDQQDLKTACLEGALFWSFINCNCGLSGIPCKSQVFASQAVPQKKYSKNGNSVGQMLFGHKKSAANGGGERHDVPFKNFEINETFLMNGMDVELGQNEYLTMNGKQLDRGHTGNYNLYFTEDGLYLRSESNVDPLVPANTSRQDVNIEDFMKYASRFPLYKNDKDKEKLVLWTLPEL